MAKKLDHEGGSVGDTTQFASIANALVEGASAAGNGIYVIVVMATDPTGESDSGGGEDNIVVVITATDVDEAPSVKGATDMASPVLEHKLPESTKAVSSNLFVDDDDNSDAPDPIRYLGGCHRRR